jgi:DMSO/TMAO reductase YedYZ molybdopterin-dependent catalytic subunit
MGDRPDVRYPKFKEHFSLLDFSADRPVPLISLYAMPGAISREEARISVCGLDCKAHVYTWHDLQKIPRVKTRMPLICQIFNWAEVIRWEGWRLKDVLEALGTSGKENRYYAFYSRDKNYFESLTRKEAMDERSLVICGMNGKDLSHEHGGPVRLAVPFLQGYKSVKWLAGIRSFQNDPLGIKILLAQSKTGKLAPAWKNKYGLGPLEGRVVHQERHPTGEEPQ